MRHRRNEGSKVWHNPELAVAPRRGNGPARSDAKSAGEPREQAQHRAALEALFAPKKGPEEKAAEGAANAPTKPAGRIVLKPATQSDPRALERQRLLAKLLAAEGRPGVSKAANEFLKAGFAFPDEQDVHLTLLEHADESRVSEAIDALAKLLAAEPPKRRAVLESRLRRIEEYAEETSTRKKAGELRRVASGRPACSRA